jgi:hypothetical protein
MDRELRLSVERPEFSVNSFWFLVDCIRESASPVRAVLRGRPSWRRSNLLKRGGHGGPPVQV